MTREACDHSRMRSSQGIHLYTQDAVPYILEWTANASTTTGAAQNVPKSGLATSDTATVGQLCLADRVATQLELAFVGDVANVAGQTINCTIIVTNPAGVATTYASLLGSSPLATTAGAKRSGVIDLSATPIAIPARSLVRATITPSAGLTAVVTNVNLALA